MKAVEWTTFPVQSSWQLAQYKPISLRIYNLCVASNVSLFSGWEPHEFSLHLLRRRHGDKHFGVNIDNGRVAGHLSSPVEEEICRQWDQLTSLLQSFPEVEYARRMGEVKMEDWYIKEAQEREEMKRDKSISKFCEDDGIHVFLAFSSICLRLAMTSCFRDEHAWNGLIQAALSVLLPIVSLYNVRCRHVVVVISETILHVPSFPNFSLSLNLALIFLCGIRKLENQPQHFPVTMTGQCCLLFRTMVCLQQPNDYPFERGRLQSQWRRKCNNGFLGMRQRACKVL